MSDSESEFQDPIPSQPSNAADVFRRSIHQTVRAAHAWRNRATAASYGEELVARLPSLSGSFQLPEVPSASRQRRRRISRSSTDRRRNKYARVRFTALDRPGVTRTSAINKADLLAKGLYRREDTDVQMPLDSTYESLCEKCFELFPVLNGVQCDLMIGRGRNILEELDHDTTLSDIKRSVPRNGFARLWIRPREPVLPGPTVLSSTATASTQPAPTTAPTTTASTQPAPTTAPTTTASTQPAPTTAPTTTASTQPAPTTAPTTTASTQPAPTTAPTTTASTQPAPTTAPTTTASTQPAPTTAPTTTASTQPAPTTAPTYASTTDSMEHDHSADSLHLELEMSIDDDILYGVHQLQQQTAGASHHVIVSRENIVQDMLTIYGNLYVTNKIQVSFENEMGIDQGGVTKELFALFWERVFLLYFKGQDAKVPHIQIKDRMMARNIFPLLGKILEHQLRILGSFPAELCRSCVLAMAHQEQDVDPDILIEDFIRFLPEPDAVLIERCLDAPSWSVNDSRRLLRLYSVNRLTVLPSLGNLRECLLNMAQTELLDSCNSLLYMMRSGMTEEMKSLFLDVVTAEQVVHFFSKLSSTPERVAELIDDYYERSDLQILEQVVVTHLSNCIREMNQRQLVRFLRWLTGSTSMPTGLEVMFNSTVGIGRAPVAHTCGNLIELSTQYETYEDFRSEFMSVIGSDEAFVFSMV